jgi:uncharacterized protein YndB with AHSA1/START domain
MERFFYAIYIKTTPEPLWEALTNPDFTQRYWWGRRLTTDWKVGSEIKALYADNKLDWQGKVLIFQPPTKLSYTFHLEEVPALKNDKPSVVTFEITPAGKSVVKLAVTHTELSRPGLDDVSSGWPQLLCCMKSVMETGETLVYGGV